MRKTKKQTLFHLIRKSRKRDSMNQRLHLFVKDEKRYPFYQLALVATRQKINCHSKRLARVLNFKI